MLPAAVLRYPRLPGPGPALRAYTLGPALHTGTAALRRAAGPTALTSTSSQRPGAKRILSSFSRPTMAGPGRAWCRSAPAVRPALCERASAPVLRAARQGAPSTRRAPDARASRRRALIGREALEGAGPERVFKGAGTALGGESRRVAAGGELQLSLPAASQPHGNCAGVREIRRHGHS